MARSRGRERSDEQWTPDLIPLFVDDRSEVRLSLGSTNDSPILGVGVDRLVYAFSGVLSRPVTIMRANVHSVWLRPFVGAHLRPGADSLLGRVLDVPFVYPWPISWRYAPDLGGLAQHENRNLLIVLNEPMKFESRAGWWNDLADASVSTFVRDGTEARGFWARIRNVELAREVLADWPTADRIPRDVLEWLHATQWTGPYPREADEPFPMSAATDTMLGP